jgi:nitrate reductase NapAB chaperone NapD
LANSSLQTLAEAGPFVLGESLGLSQAVVLETTDPDCAAAWHQWACELHGVLSVEVVFVHWDNDEDFSHVSA